MINKTFLMLLMVAITLGLSGGYAIGQTDPLAESVTTITNLEITKDTQIIQLEFETLGFDAEIVTATDAVTISETQKAAAKADLIDKLAVHQAILDQINAILAAP